MTLEFECPACEALLRVPVARAGSPIDCPCCRHRFTIPNSPYRDPLPQIDTPVSVSIREILSTSWRLYTRHLPVLIGSILFKILWFICALVSVIFFAFAFAQNGPAPKYFLIIFLPLVLFITSAQTSLHFKRTCLSIAAGYRILPEFSQPLKIIPLNYLGSTLLFQFLLVLGFCLLFVPGILFWLVFWPHTYCVILPQFAKENPFSAARRLTTNQIRIGVTLGLLSIALEFCGAALIITILLVKPLISMIFAVAFLRLRGLPVNGDPGYLPPTRPWETTLNTPTPRTHSPDTVPQLSASSTSLRLQ